MLVRVLIYTFKSGNDLQSDINLTHLNRYFCLMEETKSIKMFLGKCVHINLNGAHHIIHSSPNNDFFCTVKLVKIALCLPG